MCSNEHVKELSFAVGDTVKWRSQAGGNTVDKMGQVVRIVPKNMNLLWNCGALDLISEYECASALGGGGGRNHDSVLVLVDRGTRKPMLYWPRVSQLTLCESQPTV